MLADFESPALNAAGVEFRQNLNDFHGLDGPKLTAGIVIGEFLRTFGWQEVASNTI